MIPQKARPKSKGLTYYCDFVLTLVAGFSLYWGIAEGFEYWYRSGTTFDLKATVVCVAATAACVLLARKKFEAIAGTFGVVAAIPISKFATSGDPRALVFVLVIVVIAVIVFFSIGYLQHMWGKKVADFQRRPEDGLDRSM